jgi:DNA invertase Pin-like site-specific DNA recombinase
MKIGYARVSTFDQDTALQISALRNANCDRIIQEKQSAVKHRPKLSALLAEMRQGDLLVIYKIDRLARSLQHLVSILERLQDKGASLQSLTEPISLGTPAGRMMLHVLGAVAEFERAIIRERCMAGQLEAVKAGRLIGRPSRIPLQDQNELIRLFRCGIPHRDIAHAYDVSPTRVRQLHDEATGRIQRKFGEVRAAFLRDFQAQNLQ